jgi:arylsulfatase A-like enzyme
MIIFSSDNGPVLDDGYCDRAYELNGSHRAAGPLRGGKYSKFEGGTRIPFIVSYKGLAHRGISEALVSQVDLFASFASMLGLELPDDSAVDSQDMFAALVGDDPKGRDELLAEDETCGKLLRSGDFAYLSPAEGAPYDSWTRTELGVSRDPMLFNLSYDIGQQSNVAWDFPEVVKDMEQRVQKIMTSPKNR